MDALLTGLAGIAIGEGSGGEHDLRALVFLVIAASILVQGLSGGLVARLLGIRRARGQGHVILGARPLARTLARLLTDSDEEVVLIDASANACREAEREGFRVIFGNPLEERVLRAAGLLVAIQSGSETIDPSLVHQARAHLLFGRPIDLELWSVRIRRGLTTTEDWIWEPPRDVSPALEEVDPIGLPPALHGVILALAARRETGLEMMRETSRVRAGDEVIWLVFSERRAEAGEWLASTHWRRRPPARD